MTWCELDMFVLNSSPAIYEDFNYIQHLQLIPQGLL